MAKFFLAPSLFLLFQHSLMAQEQLPLPEGCGNPFVQAGIFGDFYEKAIRTSVVEGGRVTDQHVHLFSVNLLRKHLAATFPDPTDGDVVDRHIRAQLCKYAEGKSNLTTLSLELHQHLLNISSKLLRDVKSITAKAEEKLRERQKLADKFDARQGLLDRAEDLARKEVSSYLTKN